MMRTQNKLRSAFEGFGFAFIGCMSSWYVVGLVLSLFFATLKAVQFLWFGGIAGLVIGALIFFMVLTMYNSDGTVEY
ncbi:hypothetical protein [Telluribacter sp.]|jgi:uncharacterized membrane-anchored protein|uniref:hypothetical protein n=1 Tax=Telluribacter sp. TaxID=1978767 RepID=UPI002E121B86|nr:hypothetical protein [Telluribacter sp.]